MITKLNGIEIWSKILITRFDMKKIAYISSLLLIVLFSACEEDGEVREANFKDQMKISAYDYIRGDSLDRFSKFLNILEKGKLDITLNAYNPHGNGYTVFLPDNDAVDGFIEQSSRFSSLDDLLNDQDYVEAFSRFHVVRKIAHTNDFPFGAFSEPTLSGDYLTVSFISEVDSAYYKINNQASVTRPNIKVSNGYVHEIESALIPVTFTTYEWLERNGEFSIFKEAVDITGLRPAIDFSVKEEENRDDVTVLAEPDSVFHKKGINNIEDLIGLISPDKVDYTDPLNPLYNFVGLHFIKSRKFIDDFVDINTNYTTYSDQVPLNINGKGLDIAINEGQEVFDTIVSGMDTTLINFIKFYYDESNVTTLSGPLHFIDRVMRLKRAYMSVQNFSFGGEPVLNSYRNEVGSFLIEIGSLSSIEWSGADLYYVNLGSESESNAWGNDYLQIDGDFTISYTIPKIIGGKYEVQLRALSFGRSNAGVELFIDGNKIGGLVDLTKSGNPSSPFSNINLGTVDLVGYSEHEVKIRSLIPGLFLWDVVRFLPSN